MLAMAPRQPQDKNEHGRQEREGKRERSLKKRKTIPVISAFLYLIAMFVFVLCLCKHLVVSFLSLLGL
jgi:hypothetical protein